MSATAPNQIRELPASADLVVIGGGVIGAATAFFAARAGIDAVVLERRPALATLSTSAATGAFRLQFDNAEELALVRESVALFTRFAEAAKLPGYDLAMHTQGYLWLATTDTTAARQRALVERQRGWGLTDVELFDGVEARRRFPYLAPEVIQARWRAGDGWLDPKRLALGYAAASRAAFASGVEVLGFDVAGNRVCGVHTSRGSIACARAVIAAGPFSGVVARMAGVELPIAPVRRQRLVLPDVPEVPPHAPMTIDEENGAHWRPAERGAHALWTAPDTAPGPPLDDVPATDEGAFALLDPTSPVALARVSPFWRAVWERGSTAWYARAGQYDYTPDHRPLIGALPVEGLFVNGGYSGHGIMASAGGSRLLIDVMLGHLDPLANSFRPDRPLVPLSHDVL